MPATQTYHLPLPRHEPFPLATFRFAIHKKSARVMGSSIYKIFGTRKLRLNNCKSGSYDSGGGADIDPRTPCRARYLKDCNLAGVPFAHPPLAPAT
ncbi:MAG: hypothetical protein FWH20_08870 [Oscillospiraceae bacterium]|nr:hypothetical protein [Oscillospiraceae bacterium]